MLNLERIALLLCKRKGLLNIQDFTRPLSLDVTSAKKEGQREPNRKRIIQTLHPAKMMPMGQSTYDISEATRLRFSLHDENRPLHVHLHKIKGRPSFPDNTRGVLYYHTDPCLPPVAGEVRFRLCDTVEKFDLGSDLHIRGEPWSLRLTRIAFTPNFTGLRELLLKEGLVDPQMMSDISKLPNLDRLDERLVLFHLSQPFHVDLGAHTLLLTLVTRNAVEKIRFSEIFMDRRFGYNLPLYRGFMTVRFELSGDKKSGPKLVLRFLNYTSEIEHLLPGHEGTLLYPKPGDLLQRRPRSHLQPKIWSYPLNKRKYGPVLKGFIATTGLGFR